MTTTIPRTSAILGAARALAAKLLLAVPIDRAALSEAMTESAGGNDAAGAWQQRDSFEALEVALSLAIPELVGPMDVGAAISTLEALSRELPTHTVRSEGQVQFQQFSTPPALAVRTACASVCGPRPPADVGKMDGARSWPSSKAVLTAASTADLSPNDPAPKYLFCAPLMRSSGR